MRRGEGRRWSKGRTGEGRREREGGARGGGGREEGEGRRGKGGGGGEEVRTYITGRDTCNLVLIHSRCAGDYE